MPIVNLSNYVRCWSCNRAMHLPAYADPQANGNRAFMCQECYERADAQSAKGSQTQASQGECNQKTQHFVDTPVARAKWEMPTEEEAKYCWSIYSNFKAGCAESMREALRIFVGLRNHKL